MQMYLLKNKGVGKMEIMKNLEKLEILRIKKPDKLNCQALKTGCPVFTLSHF